MFSIIIGFILDIIIGDPDNPFHPVRFIGKLCSIFEKITRKLFKNSLKFAGLITWILVSLVSVLLSLSIVKIAFMINFVFGIIIEGVIIYFCISCRALHKEGRKVIESLEKGDINESRKRLSYIVGRDTKNLDEKGIIRAVIETIAENISDGVIAPLLFIGIFGAVGGVLYKAVNTMDSMFGYKNEKYIEFGYFAAKIDDIFNFIPSRLTGFFVIVSSLILNYNYINSFKIFKRDRKKHLSPNSAQSESAVAGALEVRLGGPNYYFGKLVEKPFLGTELKTIEISDVKRAVKILYTVSFIGFIVSISLSLSVFLISYYSVL
ncbi:cobalamin biosynthesis protein [Clostridium sp. BJN0001]|uniref:cobalamin biosynthesis protein n=1 Tax=Clostridium sp. BJN0001 TaxID=2930219 RepID=UPI001FD5D705|nr:cobalamin biosynthesis protein [Clostridium sp. BJN0001]